MKKLLAILFLLALFPCAAQAATGLVTICDATAVAAGSAYTSSSINVSNAEGYFSLQLTVTGDGTAAIGYQVSNDGSVFATPEGVSDIIIGFTKTSGGGGDGNAIEQITPEFGRYIRFIVREAGGTSGITVTLKAAIR